MEKALLKAIEGGMAGVNSKTEVSVDFVNDLVFFRLNGNEVVTPLSKILLTIEFWKCLGKAEGWTKGWETKDAPHPDGSYKVGWLHHWHNFIDHLAEEKDVESFFNSLLK